MKHPFQFLILIAFLLGFISCSKETECTTCSESKTETFTFASNNNYKGKIYLPASYQTNKSLPVVYLLDTKENLTNAATDEFQQLINSIGYISGLDAIVVTLTELLITEDHGFFPEYIDLFKQLTAYVDDHYESNGSKTLVGRGNAAGILLVHLFENSNSDIHYNNFIATDPYIDYIRYLNNKIAIGNFPMDKNNLKLHYSFTENYELNDNKTFINRINEKNYSWLSFGTSEYPEISFEEAYPTAFQDGLRFIFNK